MRTPQLCFGLAFALLTVSCSDSRHRGYEARLASLRAADAAWSATTDSLDAFMAFFHEDALMVNATGTLVGRDAIRQAMAPGFATPAFSLTWTLTDAVLHASGEMGTTYGDWTGTAPDSAGAPMAIGGRYATTWIHQSDGTWVIWMDVVQ